MCSNLSIADRMYSVPYLADDISDQTDRSLVDKAGHGDHVEYRDHLGVLQQMAIVLKLHSKDGQTVWSSAQVVSEVLELLVHEADIIHIL